MIRYRIRKIGGWWNVYELYDGEVQRIFRSKAWTEVCEYVEWDSSSSKGM